MRRKNVLILLSIVLIIVSVCMFVACDDKNDNNTNGNNNNDTVNGSQSITLTEGMSVDEVKEALADVKSFKYKEESTKDESVIYHIDENGMLGVAVNEHNVRTYIAYFHEGNKGYSLERTVENAEERQTYTWTEVESDAEAEGKYSSFMQELLDNAFESVKNGEMEMSIQEGRLVFTENDGHICTIYDFDNTTLPIEEYFPDYKTKAVEVEE